MNNFFYSASKAAFHVLARHRDAELIRDVLVNALAAGLSSPR
ncbi:MAG TPA: hypothetical protein VME67_25110 [Mycobacterium sp.]|nr:hypothetical protein [Mycobacterium sp.]HTX97823.1 hypothetical protein [Mycobacterium sp.]